MRRRRFTAEQWTAWLEEFGQGDFTVAEFCKLKGVCTNSFYQWRRKIGPSVPSPAFVPVEVVQPASIEIDLPGGATIRVPNDSASLRPVLQVLGELGANR